MKAIFNRVNVILLALIGIIAITISLLDFFGWLPPDTTVGYGPVILLFLGLLAVHLIISSFKQEDALSSLESKVQRLHEHATGVVVRNFEDASDLENYLAKRLLDARHSICDLTWKARISPDFSTGKRRTSHGYYESQMPEACERIAYKEVFIFNDQRRFEKLIKRLEENKDGYSCRYFPEDSVIPRLQFVIIDEEEVLFFAMSAYGKLCSLSGKEIVNVMKPYFEEIWNQATPIKEGPTIYYDEVERIKRKIKISNA